MSGGSDGLLAVAEEAALAARRLGADEAEAFATRVRSTSIAFQKNDLRGASTDDETTLGIRVFVGGSLGFATANRADDADAIAREAIAIARVAPPDPGNALPEALPVTPWPLEPDPALEGFDVERLAGVAGAFLERACSKDSRVSVDSGGASVDLVTRAIASTRGVRGIERHATAGGSLFGMAVEGDVVGSFDYDGDSVRSAAALEPALASAADRFVIKTLGALHTRRGESFRGTVIFSPEVVSDFLVDNLLAVLSAKAVRTGKSPLGGKVGQAIAAPSFTLVDDASDPARTAGVAFDREGLPTRHTTLVEHGVLARFLYDSFEARAAGGVPAGNARGGAASLPVIGAVAPSVPAGETSFAELCAEPGRAVLVSRFSGSSNPITGEFSGVVKGGFLLKSGERVAIREVQISGNLYDALKSISGSSRETRLIDGNVLVPAIRAEDVSVTAG